MSSYSSAILNNPDIDNGVQLARRQAEGIEDLYFHETAGDNSSLDDHPDQVDLTDEVTRRVDPATLPLDPIDEHESYKEVNGKNYLVGHADVGGGKHVPYLREVLGRGYYSDTKMALIGGKLYEIEFEKDPETRRIKTYLTSSVGDLFSNDQFLKDQTPAQKLELLGKIRKSATFRTWYDSGEYNRYSRQKYDGEVNPELDPTKVRDYAFDDGATKLEDDLKKQAGQPAKDPLSNGLQQVSSGPAAGIGPVLGVALYVGGTAVRKNAGGTVSEDGKPLAAPQPIYRRVQWRPQPKQLTSSYDSPRNWRRFN